MDLATDPCVLLVGTLLANADRAYAQASIRRQHERWAQGTVLYFAIGLSRRRGDVLFVDGSSEGAGWYILSVGWP